MRLDGLTQEEKTARQISFLNRQRSFQPAEVRFFIEETCLTRLDYLMKHILLIWKTWMWGTGHRSVVMRTGMSLRR